jgi:hypothetical protein
VEYELERISNLEGLQKPEGEGEEEEEEKEVYKQPQPVDFDVTVVWNSLEKIVEGVEVGGEGVIS